jgi:membrane-bound ClpP family serine protease
MLDNQVKNNGLKGYLLKKLQLSSLSTTTMILLLLPVAVFISVVVAKMGIIGVAGILALIIGVPVVYGIIAYPNLA